MSGVLKNMSICVMRNLGMRSLLIRGFVTGRRELL